MEPNLRPEERIASLIAGGAMTLLGVSRGKMIGTLLSLIGGGLIVRGVTGRSRAYSMVGINRNHVSPSRQMSVPHERGVKIVKTVLIHRPPSELYQFWRNFENLSRIMSNVESVRVLSSTRSHWVVKAPLGRTVEWDAEIVNEIPNKLIGWRSLEHADVDNAGSVEFEDHGMGRGTKVTVTLKYSPPRR